jgi:hypothetical protein
MRARRPIKRPVDNTSSPCTIWLVTWSFGVDYSHMETGKLPRSAPAVLNHRCRTHLDMSRSSLGVVLRGLPARGWSVTFPVWRKRCFKSVCCFRYLYTHTYLLTCETGYWSIFIYVYMTGCAKYHVYFSTFVFANESWFFLCRVLSFIVYWLPCHIHINKNRSITCFTGK